VDPSTWLAISTWEFSAEKKCTCSRTSGERRTISQLSGLSSRKETAGRKLIRAYYYASFNPENEEVKERQTRFHHALQDKGFHVVAKPLRKRNNGLIEKGIDIASAVDILSLGFHKAYDVAVLVSGDGDFIRAIEVIKSMGLRVEVAMFRNALNPDLKRIADRFIALDELADEIEKK